MIEIAPIETLTGKWSDQLEYIIFKIGESSVNCHFFLAHWLYWIIRPWQEGVIMKEWRAGDERVCI